MTLYIEYIILDNFIVDMVIVGLVEMTLRRKLSISRKVMSCIAGTLLVLAVPYMYNLIFLLYFYRFLTLFFVVLLLKKFKSIKEYFLYVFLYLSYTWLLGGVLVGIIFMLKIDVTMSGLIFYSFEFPISVFILMAYFIFKILKKMIVKSINHIYNCQYLLPIKITDNNITVEGVGFYDSGNSVVCDGEYVNLISLDMFMNLYKDIGVDVFVKDKRINNLKNIKYIHINGIGKSEKYMSFTVDKCVVGKDIFINPRFALVYKKFTKFDCILNSKFYFK